MSAIDRSMVEVRAAGSGDPLPDAFVAEPVGWDGQAIEIVYDPRRVKVLRLSARSIDDDVRRQLAESGWRHAGTDEGKAELWVGRQDEVGKARLDRLVAGAAGVPPPSLGLS